MEPRDASLRRVRFGTFELDLETGDLRRAGAPVHLQAQPTAVLLLLVERTGQLVTREDIGRRLWGDRWQEFDPGINTCISQVRNALGDNAASPVFVATVPRRGYRFIAPVHSLSASPTRAASSHAAPRWPVAAAALLALGAFAALAAVSRAGQTEDPGPRVMLAVLPFETMDADSSLDYVSAGLTEELITVLANVEPDRLGVIARTSSTSAWRAGHSIDRIGQTLGVDFVVEGAVRSGGDRLRISAQLVRVSDQSHVWADTWERGLVDVLDIQQDIAGRVVGALALRLTPVASPNGETAVASPARQLTLEARYLLDNRQPARALALLDSATAADSSYAPAWTAAARALAATGNPDRARDAARRAVALDHGQVEAHLLLAAALHQSDWNWNGAALEYRRALNLAPGRADVHHARALFLASMGRLEEAVASIEHAMRLDPVSTLVIGDVAFVHYLARDFDRAERYARRVLALDAHNIGALTQLVNIAAQRGAIAETVEHGAALGRAVRGDTATAPADVAVADSTGAWGTFWRSWIAWFRANTSGPTREYQSAIGFIRLGQPDSAVAELERSFSLRAGGLTFLAVDPAFEEIRTDSAFDAIVRKIGLGPRLDDSTGR
jgi:TolB-like protein/Flp pilus assembly protein TadD